MRKPKNVTDIVNMAKSNFMNEYLLLNMKRQPDTKPRDEEQRDRMIILDAEMIKNRIDLSLFKPAPKEVVDAYAKNKQR
jgi:hypothetical protein